MLNRTVFQGRLTRDVELRKTQNDISVAGFTVAWSEKYKDTETQCFLDCSAWRQNAEFIAKYFTKGQEIIVEGKLVTQKWEDKDGNKRTSIKLEVEKAHFCGAKKDGGGGYSESSGYNAPAPSEPAQSDFSEIPDDGELPFD
jgi:single-strand DNA-binding protein